jgi:hypothetical protein
MRLLYGDNQYDTPGVSIDTDWEDLVMWCADKRTTVRQRSDKWKAGWVWPMTIHPHFTSRKITDAATMSSLIGLDVDKAGWRSSVILSYLRGVACIVYSTMNSTEEAPRWRIPIRLSRDLTIAEFAGVWRACNIIMDDQVDEKTKNCNRLHYMPAQWIGGNNEFHVQDGSALDVDTLLQVCPPEEPAFYATAEAFDGVMPPDGDVIITEAIYQRYIVAGSAGGRFWKMLLAAATRYKCNGWALSASDLANAALRYSRVDSSGMRRGSNALHEAERAIASINCRVSTPTALDRLHDRLKWRYSRSAA